MVMNEADIQI